MGAVCGVVGTGHDERHMNLLDGVLAAFEHHGSITSTTSVGLGSGGALFGARHDGDREPCLALSPAGDGLAVVGDLRLDYRDELTARLSESAAASDAELVLAAYRRWGTGCLEHVHGDFALAIADPARGGVLLARDHAGHAPLVIHEGRERVGFASTALALTGLDGVGHELDEQRIAEILALAYGTDRTLVTGVRSVPAGTALWIEAGGVRRRWTWWNPPTEINDLGALSAHADALRDAFDGAVETQMRSAGVTGVMLSGGLDSTAIAATAASQIEPNDLRTYTSVPPASWTGPPEAMRDPDERHLVERLARDYPNLCPRFVDVDGRHPFEHHEVLWELGSGPIRNAINAMWVYAIFEEAAADGVRGLLTGAAGNAAFSADGPRWLVELLRRGQLGATGREVAAWAKTHETSRRSVVRSHFLPLVTPSGMRRLRARLLGHPSRVDDWLGATALRDAAAEQLDLVDLLPTLGRPDTSGWTRERFANPTASSAQAETLLAVRAWWGVTQLDPTADRRVLDVALPQPEWWRRHHGIDRAVVRAAMADRLPSEIVDRTRRGAQLPDWFDRLSDARADIEAEIEEMRDHPTSRQFIDVERLQAAVHSWPTRDESFDREANRTYRLALARAVIVSRYVRWFERRARRVASGGPAVVVLFR